MILTDIEKLIKGLRLTSRWKELSLTVFFLIKGLKSAFIWDLGQITTNQLLKLSSIIDELIVIEIAGDFIISSRKGLTKQLKNIFHHPPLIIDVSGTLSDPVILTLHQAQWQYLSKCD